MNKFLAKIAPDMRKPDGIYLIPPEKTVEFVEKLPIEKFFGIGKVTAEKMHDMGITTGYDLKQFSEIELIKKFGKVGKYYYHIARAEDDRKVNPHRIIKSISTENTFSKDLLDIDDIMKALEEIRDILLQRMKRSNTIGKTLTVKINDADFQVITRSKTLKNWIEDEAQMKHICEEIVTNIDIRDGIRLLGLALSHLNLEESVQKNNESGSQLELDL